MDKWPTYYPEGWWGKHRTLKPNTVYRCLGMRKEAQYKNRFKTGELYVTNEVGKVITPANFWVGDSGIWLEVSAEEGIDEVYY